MANLFDVFDNDPPANFFARFDSQEDAEPLALDVPQKGPTNFFARFDDDADRSASSEHPKGAADIRREERPNLPAFATGEDPYGMLEGISISNARDAAKTLTDVEQKAMGVGHVPSILDEPIKESASFWGAMEHGLGNRNIEAYADTLDHLAERSDDPNYAASYRNWAQSLRRAVEEDGSTYKPVFRSFREINGLSDAWGFVKEVAGEQIGIQIPSIAGAVTGGYIGQKVGAPFGRTGRVVGGFTGATTGAMTGMVHHHISEMRRALQREKIEGPELAEFTEYGAAVLVSLDLVFPVVAGLKWSGPARQVVAKKVAGQLIKGGRFRTPAEFVKRFGKEIARDVALLEVPTEIAQEAVTEFVPTKIAGKDITTDQISRFATETVPEIAIRTAIGAAPLTAPGSAIQARRDVEAGRTIRNEQELETTRRVARVINAQQDIQEAQTSDLELSALNRLRAAVQDLQANEEPEAIQKAARKFSWANLDAEKGLSESLELAGGLDEMERAGFTPQATKEQVRMSVKSFAGRRANIARRAG